MPSIMTSMMNSIASSKLGKGMALKTALKGSAILLGLSLSGLNFADQATKKSETSSWQCEHQEHSVYCKTQQSQQELQLPAAPYDWYLRDQLPEELKRQVSISCGGMYIERAIENQYSHLPEEQQPVTAMADSIYSIGDQLHMFSRVEIQHNKLSVQADVASLDRQTNTLDLSGSIEIREPGLLVSADSATLDLENNSGKFEDTEYVLHNKHMFGTAQTLSRPEDEVIVITEGSYSSCSPVDRDWSIYADEIIIDNELGWGVAKHMVFKVKDVPVFYFPRMEFPVDDRRMSGFLFPSFATSTNGGFEIATPYYLNLAPNYDATLTPRYLTKHGFLAETEFRYKNEFSEWAFTNNYLNNDKETDEARWLTNTVQTGQFGDHISSGLTFTRVSDDDYLKDLEPTVLNLSNRDNLLQRAHLTWNSARWRARGEFTDYQTIRVNEPKPYAELPKIAVNFRPSGSAFKLQPLFNNEYVFFDSEEKIRGQRFFNETGLNYPMRFDAGYFLPAVKVWNVYYDLNDSNDVPAPASVQTSGNLQSNIPSFNFLTGVYLDRNVSRESGNFVHTLEPKLFYVHTDRVDQSEQPNFDTSLPGFSYNSLFRDNDFVGYDRVSDTHKVSLALENYYVNADSGEPLFVFKIGQSFFADDREVTLPNASVSDLENAQRSSSMIATQTGVYFAKNWELLNELVYEPYENKIDSNLSLLKYQTGPYTIFNLGLFFRQNEPRLNPVTAELEDDDTEQILTSVAMPVAQNWQLFGATQYDLIQDQSLNSIVGVEYNSCCWQMRLAYLYELEEDNGLFDPVTGAIEYDRSETIFFEIQLKGLGGFANRIEGLLEKTIFGYGDETYTHSSFR